MCDSAFGCVCMCMCVCVQKPYANTKYSIVTLAALS